VKRSDLLSRLLVSLYGGLLRLYPRKFQQEFGGEMLGVFACSVKEALSSGALALLQVLFFEMLDFPVSLAIEHASQWRKEWSMKDTRHGIRPFRSAAMGALGLLIGFLIAMWGSKALVLSVWWYKADFGRLVFLRDMLPGALTSALASALLGLMLCLSVSGGKRILLRACLFMAGLELFASLIGAAITRFTHYQIFFDQFLGGNERIVALALETALIAMIDGLFTGAGLGLAAGGWKSGARFALKGMLAYGLAFAIWETIYSLWIDSGWWIGTTAHPMSLITFAIGGTVYSFWMWTGTSAYLVSIITFCICGILAGGILGWLWGRESSYQSVRGLEGSPVN
jgi:hypothetical protein